MATAAVPAARWNRFSASGARLAARVPGAAAPECLLPIGERGISGTGETRLRLVIDPGEPDDEDA